LGLPSRKPKGYWTEQTIKQELDDLTVKLKHFPAESERSTALQGAISKHGGINRLYGLPVKQNRSHYWTEELIKQRLNDLTVELGHFPITSECPQNLLSAMKKRGGIKKFRSQYGL
jgi:hypothetical protein